MFREIGALAARARRAGRTGAKQIRAGQEESDAGTAPGRFGAGGCLVAIPTRAALAGDPGGLVERVRAVEAPADVLIGGSPAEAADWRGAMVERISLVLTGILAGRADWWVPAPLHDLFSRSDESEKHGTSDSGRTIASGCGVAQGRFQGFAGSAAPREAEGSAA